MSQFFNNVFRASRIINLGTCFFVHLITCLHTHSFVDGCVDAKVHLAVLLLQRQKYFREYKVSLRSIPLTINPEPGYK